MSYINEFDEHPEFGTYVTTYKEDEYVYPEHVRGCDLYRRGNMCFLITKNGILIDKSHVEDIEYLLGLFKRKEK